MSCIHIKLKDIHKIVIFRLFTNFYIYIYIYIYKFTSKCYSQTTHPWSWNNQTQETTSLAPSAQNQTQNYDKERSNHHPSLSTQKSIGLIRG